MDKKAVFHVPVPISELPSEQVRRLLRESWGYGLFAPKEIEIAAEIEKIIESALEYVGEKVDFVDKENNEFGAKEIVERDWKDVVDARDDREKLETIRVGINMIRKKGEDKLWKRYRRPAWEPDYKIEEIDRERIHYDWEYFDTEIIDPYRERMKDIPMTDWLRALKKVKALWRRNMALRWWSARVGELKSQRLREESV
jgi:hypothetical protein